MLFNTNTIEVKFMSQTLLYILGIISGYNRKVRAEKENILIQDGFSDWSALKVTKSKEKLKYLNWSANCSTQKILSTRKKQSIRTVPTRKCLSFEK